MAKKYYDSGMISENRNAVANLPQEVIIKQYPKTHSMKYSELDDTIRVIDNQIKSDATGPKIKKSKMPEKY